MVKGEGIGNTREAWASECIDPYVNNSLVRSAFRKVDRRSFAPAWARSRAFTDEIIDLGNGSSMSQPSLVARMLDHLELSGKEKVLEIGTASGYNAALLSACSREVSTVEYNPQLATTAKKRLDRLGYKNVTVVTGDGALGDPEHAPFDRIIVTASAREIPNALIDQLAMGGVMVLPVGRDLLAPQDLAVAIKKEDGLWVKSVLMVKFYPLVSAAHGGWTDERKNNLLEGKKHFVAEHPDQEMLKLMVELFAGIPYERIDTETLIEYVPLNDEQYDQYIPPDTER